MAEPNETAGVTKTPLSGADSAAPLAAVAAGLLALLLIAAIAIGVVNRNNSQAVASIATAAFGVIGSVVGSYFGVKVGAEGTRRALDAHKAEAARAQAYAAHLPEARARQALIDADKMARGEPIESEASDSPDTD